ncbi:MAG: ABC transporter substrate-binding protein [Planctomycetota bacterium]
MTKPKIRVGGVPEHFNIPWHNALLDMEANAFPFEIEFVECSGGTGEMTRAMKDGQLDLSLLLFEGAVNNILRGNENRIVKVYVNSPLIWGIHVAARSSIQQVDEIRDKVYAISRAGSGSHLIAIVDAAERNWPIDKMKFSKVGNLAGAREKLANGKVDVFLWEKYTTKPLVDSGEFRRVGQRMVPWPAFVVSVRKKVLDLYGAEIKRLLQLVDRHCNQFKSSSDAAEVVSSQFGIQIEDCQNWLDHVEWNSGFECPENKIFEIAKYLKQIEVVETEDFSIDEVWHSF